ncbi:Remorin family protein [Rhynchospora pubera]|uniref:Remorin family protein n=1 Tax=Rhynchospora pubera TaxID=906938 RepID=A0AAV8CQ15_9POAL|nr:Remorin family protein [Rhynchospora pubera]
MEVKASTFLQPSTVFHSTSKRNSTEETKQDPFGLASFNDPLCKLNLKETSDFVKSLPMASTSAQRSREDGTNKRIEGPTTPGRPLFFSFSPSHLYRKNVPSKWEDAEKWLVGTGSCHDSPLHGVKMQETLKASRLSGGLEKKGGTFLGSEKVLVEKPVRVGNGASGEVLLKDKFTESTEQLPPNLQSTESGQGIFLFNNPQIIPSNKLNRRDVGTETTPLVSSKTSRCPTPVVSTSPVRHNTPEGRSGPLDPCNPSFVSAPGLKDFDFVKFDLNWTSKEEEEEEVSKSLRHFEMSCENKSMVESTPCMWEEEEKAKSCIRYQREEAKIQAWVNLESAKAEAQSRKLEVKIQKMRSSLEEKLMKRMANVHRKAEEWRASAQLQHLQQLQKASESAQKIKSSYLTNNKSCSCFPCSNNHN